MPETLTESFCERCGTRYEFKAPTRLNPLRKTRGFMSGLRNYIMSQDALGDALGDARRGEEETLASRQLEAFHESFNFCIDCRQYACISCWNDDAGRCLSCAPIMGTDDIGERMAAAFNGVSTEVSPAQLEADPFEPLLGIDTWPSEDRVVAAANGDGPAGGHSESYEVAATPDSPPEAWPQAEPEPVAVETEAEPVAAEMDLEPAGREQVWTDAGPDARSEPEPIAAEAKPIMSWEDDGTFELEPAVAEEPFEPVITTVEPEPLLIAESEPRPFDRRITPINDTIVRLPRQTHEPGAEPIADEVDDPSLAARRAQLDDLGLADPGEGAVTRQRPTALPYRSGGAGISPVELAARRAAPGSFWDASAREVAQAASQIGVQSCGQCGLSLSISARFCRRCGTRQARSA